MYMAYSQNPHLPHVRMEAVRLVRSGWSTVKGLNSRPRPLERYCPLFLRLIKF